MQAINRIIPNPFLASDLLKIPSKYEITTGTAAPQQIEIIKVGLSIFILLQINPDRSRGGEKLN